MAQSTSVFVNTKAYEFNEHKANELPIAISPLIWKEKMRRYIRCLTRNAGEKLKKRLVWVLSSYSAICGIER